MSTILSISFIPNTEEGSEILYKSLLSWVNSENEYVRAKRYTYPENSRVITLESVNLHEFLHSEEALSVDIKVNSFSPLALDCSLELYGVYHDSGFKRKTDGVVRLVFNERQITGEYRKLRSSGDLKKARSMEQEIFIALTALFEAVVEACGEELKYAAFYPESGLTTPFTSSMVFHSDYLELSKDFLRVFIESRTNILMPEFLNNEHDYSKDLNGDILQPEFYSNFTDKKEGSLLNFLSEIDSTTYLKFADLDNAGMRKLVVDIVDNYSEFFISNVRNGFIMTTYPFSGLWVVYKRLLNKV